MRLLRLHPIAMIMVNLKGGLGNQMFQYALGRKLSLVNKDTLMFDTGGLKHAEISGDVSRPFALDAFNVSGDVAPPALATHARYPYGILSKLLHFVKTKLLRQMYIGWVPALLQQRGNVYLDGYFQSPKYFEDIRETLLQDFTVRGAPSETVVKFRTLMRSMESVSIHVRRGDYVSNAKVQSAYGSCSLQYYQEAMKLIGARVPSPSWFVFSDDISWVKEHLAFPGEVTYVSGHSISDAEELSLMAACKHNIIANSSFSWWGAWLNQNREKIVIAPDPWFDTKKDEHKDLIPDSWIRIAKN